MIPETVGALVDRDRRSRRRAFVGREVEYDYRQLCTTAHKTGNFLSHFGVRPGRRVAVLSDGGSSAAPVLAFFGASLLGARVRFDPASVDGAVAIVAPASAVDGGPVEAPPGATVIAYGGTVSDPTVEPFGRGIWSENPACPVPTAVAGATAILERKDDSDPIDHRTLLSMADRIRESRSIDRSDAVVVRAPLSHPGTVVAGMVAPILAGAAVVRPDGSRPSPEPEGTIAIATADAPESRTIDPDDFAT